MIERIEKNENFTQTEDTGSLERSSAMMEHLGYIVFTGIFWSCFFGYLLDKSKFCSYNCSKRRKVFRIKLSFKDVWFKAIWIVNHVLFVLRSTFALSIPTLDITHFRILFFIIIFCKALVISVDLNLATPPITNCECTVSNGCYNIYMYNN